MRTQIPAWGSAQNWTSPVVGSMMDVNYDGACRSGRDSSLHDAIDRQTEA
jgi:hypothetical protein